jgi:hypothetical protein
VENQTYVCAHGKQIKDSKKEKNEAFSKDHDVSDDDEDDDEEDINYADELLQAEQNNNDHAAALDEQALLADGFDMQDLIGDAATRKGKGTKRAKIVSDRKAVRNERKLYNKIPCGQPVLSFSLRGRALIWNTTFQNRRKIMFCPCCGSLHIYSVLNFSASEAGEYRCCECARKEVMHLPHYECAYCSRSTPSQINETTHLDVLCINDKRIIQEEESSLIVQKLYFCKAHFRIACRFRGLVKEDLFKVIKHVQEEKQMQYARGIYH